MALASRALRALAVAAALLAAGCDSRPSDDPDAGGATADAFDAEGNIIGGTPELGAALPDEFSFELQADADAPRTGGDRLVPITVTLVGLDRVTVADQAISWQASAGFLERATFTTDEAGTAGATLRVPEGFDGQSIDVTVTAEGSSATLAVPVVDGASDGRELAFALSDDVGDAGASGGDTVIFSATLVDADRVPVADVPVSWSATDGVLRDAVPATDANGISTVALVLPEGMAAGDVTVTVASGAYRASSTIAVAGDGERDAGIDIELTSDAGAARRDAGTVVALTAVLIDGARNPVAGRRVSWSANGGLFRDVVSTTDDNGVAGASIVLPRTLEDSEIVVSVAAGLAVRNVRLLVAGDPEAVSAPATRLSLELSSDAGTARAPSGGVVMLTAVAVDQARLPVEGRAIDWSASGGVLREVGTLTDADGVATATLRLPTSERDAEVVVRVASGLTERRLTVRVAGTAEPDAVAADALLFELFTSATDVPTGTDGDVDVVATVTDTSRVPVAGRAVSWRASAGVLQDVESVTDDNGAVSASLRLPRDYLNRDIEIEIASGDQAASATVRTHGTTLEVRGPDSVVHGDDAALDIALRAGDGEPIANRAIEVVSREGHAVLPAGEILTDANGVAAVTVAGLNADDLITVSAFGADSGMSATHALDVASGQLRFGTAAGAELAVGAEHALTLTWTRNRIPVARRALRVATTAGAIVGGDTVTTDARGVATLVIRSDAAGPARLTAEDVLDADPSTSLDIEFVADAPASVELYATSTRVYTRGRSTVSAIVRDGRGNPVKNETVFFDGADLAGGQLSPPFARTDSDGRASVDFVAGDAATGLDAVVVSARVEIEDPNVPGAVREVASQVDARLTVVERVLNVTLGAGNRIGSAAPFTQYTKDFVVQVTDGSGTPVEGASVALSIRPVEYYKGRLELVDEAGMPPGFHSNDASAPAFSSDRWAVRTVDWYARYAAEANADPSLRRDVFETCEAEDSNRNRVNDFGEDIDGDGTLDPQDPAALAPSEAGRATLAGNGTLAADETGSGHFRMIYPRSNALWSTVEITARARALGTEAEDTFTIRLPMLAEEIGNTDESPSNLTSPYGVDAGVIVPGDDRDGCSRPD